MFCHFGFGGFMGNGFFGLGSILQIILVAAVIVIAVKVFSKSDKKKDL